MYFALKFQFAEYGINWPFGLVKQDIVHDTVSGFETDEITTGGHRLRPQHLGKVFIRESHFKECNDSLILVICLKPWSITQACRTADKQHFTLPTTVLCWFYHTTHEHAVTSPSQTQLILIAWKIIICAGKCKAQSLS